ncbi:MAG: putative zinc-binding protein [Terrimicrobiaceae bacterium]
MTDRPLIYSCSGCSGAAQLANHLAIRMDRLGAAEMSCIAGLGGDVKPLVRLAKSGRPIVMLDGCPFQCGRHTLARHGIEPDLYLDLSRCGVSKEKHVDFDPEDSERLVPQLAASIAAMDNSRTPAGREQTAGVCP